MYIYNTDLIYRTKMATLIPPIFCGNLRVGAGGRLAPRHERSARKLVAAQRARAKARASAASRVILAEAAGSTVHYEGVAAALAIPETQVLLFGKPEARPLRRMGVALARGDDEGQARARADAAAGHIRVRASR